MSRRRPWGRTDCRPSRPRSLPDPCARRAPADITRRQVSVGPRDSLPHTHRAIHKMDAQLFCGLSSTYFGVVNVLDLGAEGPGFK